MTSIPVTTDIVDVVRPITISYVSYFPYRRVEPKQSIQVDPAPGRYFAPQKALGDNNFGKNEKIMSALKGLTMKQDVTQKAPEGDDAAQRVEQVLQSDRTWRN